jgi:hypothetical protein
MRLWKCQLRTLLRLERDGAISPAGCPQRVTSEKMRVLDRLPKVWRLLADPYDEENQNDDSELLQVKRESMRHSTNDLSCDN